PLSTVFCLLSCFSCLSWLILFLTRTPEVIMADPAKLKSVKDHSVKQILLACARVPQSSTLYVGGSEFTVCEVDAAGKFDLKTMGKHESYVTTVALAGKVPVSGSYDGKLIWWDVSKKEAARTVEEAHKKWIRQVAVSPDGKTLASVADDMVCKLWD